jgi:2'-5' RNA ligase
MRAFISAELPNDLKKMITAATAGLREIESGIKWVEEQNLHLTLKFLGWVEEKDIDKMLRLAEESAKGTGSFKLKLAGMGTFPEGKSPRVIWVGITEGGERLKEIAEKLENQLSQAGFRSEEREFSTHLTLGRVKDKKGVDLVKEKMKESKDQVFGELVVDHINIMKSTLTPKGPIYEIVKEVKL